MKAGRRAFVAALPAWAAWPALAAPALAGEAVRWPEFSLLDGGRWTPAAGRAKVVVFWSVSCPFCQRHNAHIDRLHRAAGESGPQVLTVSRDRDPAAVHRYLSAHGYGFPVTLDHDALAAALAPRRIIPLTALIDRQGRFKLAIPGEMFEEDVMELLKLA